jgi:dTDP-4-amino-4,6-dideoxygalactose transaminase
MTTGGTSHIPFVDLGRHHGGLAVELEEAFRRVLGASAFIMGEEVERFEAEFAEYCGTRHCVGVASGTAALSIMLQAAGIGPGDEVIVPAHTFVASAFAVLHVGATPVCADVDSGTGLLDPAAARAAIGPRTAALLPVHLYGQVCAMDALRALADQHGLAMFEDAAQAHGATHRGVRAGALGRAGAFSFYPSKNLGALGDGGAICTDDGELAAIARRLRDLGRNGSAGHADAGYNERLDGLQAAFLRAKLPHLERWNANRRALAARYGERLSDEAELLQETPETPCVYHVYPVRVRDRKAIGDRLAELGIATGVHYPVALPDQAALPAMRGSDAPVARDWAARELSLPIFPEMTVDELERVVAGFNAAAAAS